MFVYMYSKSGPVSSWTTGPTIGAPVFGPRTVHESVEPVPFTVAQLVTSDLPGLDRMQWSLGQDIAAGSHYSGMAGDLMGLPWIQHYLEKIGFCQSPLGVGFVYADSCDILPRAQVCLTRNVPGFTHVFGDMLDRLEPNFRRELEGIAPQKKGDPEADADAFWEMHSRLDNHCARTDQFKDGSVAPCAKCGLIRDCHARSKDFKDLVFSYCLQNLLLFFVV